MNHPTQEEWIGYIYGELPPEAQERLTVHRQGCPECQQAVAQWRGTLAGLDAWQVQSPRRRAANRPYVKWALAASVLLGVGLALGRFTAPSADLRALRAQLGKELREEFRQDLDRAAANTLAMANAETRRAANELAAGWMAAREQDLQTTQARFIRAEQQRKTDLAWMRRDLETVAAAAEERLDSTQQSLGQLASYTTTRPAIQPIE